MPLLAFLARLIILAVNKAVAYFNAHITYFGHVKGEISIFTACALVPVIVIVHFTLRYISMLVAFIAV